MADLSITAANVQMTASSEVETHRAGEAITAGQPYRIANDNLAYQTQADTKSNAKARGIAVTSASAGGKFSGVEGGGITIGATMVLNEVYGVSTNKGGIGLMTDLSSGEFPFVLLYAKTTTVAEVMRSEIGEAVP